MLPLDAFTSDIHLSQGQGTLKLVNNDILTLQVFIKLTTRSYPLGPGVLLCVN